MTDQHEFKANNLMNKNGLYISISVHQTHEKTKLFIVNGKFHVVYDDLGLIVKNENILKHIILVVTRGENYQAHPAFENVVVFADDIQKTEVGCSGFFKINLFETIEFDGRGDYFVLCSMGSYTSNILKVTVG